MTDTNTDTSADTSTEYAWIERVQFNQDGLIPAIAKDAHSGEVLMVAWMNQEALMITAQTQQAVYFSRSRQKLWRKGESSGHHQSVKALHTDCDSDVILLEVEQHGGIACHTGRVSCFYQKLDLENLDNGWSDAAPVVKSPEEIYAASPSS